MADAFRERTARLLTDYLEYCAREPGTAARQPSSPEAAVLRCVAAQIREYNVRTLSVYRGFRWNRVELVAWMAQKLLASPRGPNWYRVASLLTFAGMLLERHPREACGRKKKEGNVSRDCRLLVALLCAQLSGQHRTWLLANGGWVLCSCQVYSNSLGSVTLRIESGEDVLPSQREPAQKRRAHRRTESDLR
ncbi:bcl-2-like protein 10 isoform X2 [Sus scrofa]|uniref:bcl-2-like protein 10 isoform X2 n=1 Tax=Sus scrofa TaxID=9823 RepID=UPI0006B1F7A6|nr:bcl-2-like protein 10 isoform X2 [Sus scrofa]